MVYDRFFNGLNVEAMPDSNFSRGRCALAVPTWIPKGHRHSIQSTLKVPRFASEYAFDN